MKLGRNRWLLRLGVPLFVGVTVLAWALVQGAQSRLVIENRSGQPVTVLEVTAGGATRTFKDVAPGSDVAAPLKRGTPFRVHGTLANGTLIRGQFGDLAVLGDRGALVILPNGALVPPKAGKE
jgi:hypothetical protein